MNRKIVAIAAAVACVLAPGAAMAQSAVTVYGRLDLSVDNKKTGPTSVSQLRDNASRLGFRGTEDLGGGLKAAFGAEMGFAADTGVAGNPMYRNTYVGLTSDAWGAAAMGRLDSSNPTGSPFYSLITRHTEAVIHDAGATAIGTAVLNARNRVSNAMGYRSPAMGNFIFRARHYWNGEGEPEEAAGPVRTESDLKSTDLSVSYGESGSPLGLGVAYGQDKKNGGPLLNDFKSKWMLVGAYDFGTFRTWAVAGRDNYQGGATSRDKVDFRMLGASVNVGTGGSSVIANYLTRDVQKDRSGVLKKVQVGYAHRLSKRTMVYALYDRQDPNDNVPDNTVRTISLGIQHNF